MYQAVQANRSQVEGIREWWRFRNACLEIKWERTGTGGACRDGARAQPELRHAPFPLRRGSRQVAWRRGDVESARSTCPSAVVSPRWAPRGRTGTKAAAARA